MFDEELVFVLEYIAERIDVQNRLLERMADTQERRNELIEEMMEVT